MCSAAGARRRGTPRTMKASRTARRPMSLIVLDVDHFKKINDTHGHAMGDAVLVAIAGAISDDLGETGVVARIGGEEFMILLPDTDEFTATNKAERLREIIEDLSPSGLRVTASFGVTPLRPEDNYDMIFSRADMAMYEAKRSGRNCVVAAE